MSQYLCPECKGDTGVVDTRPSYNRLRRRRTCKNNHKFSTIEVPIDAPEKITDIIRFAIENSLDGDAEMVADMIAYAKAAAREFLLGLEEQEAA